MSGTTPELALSTAVDSDDNADYLTISLANSLRTVDALFSNTSGHSHSGAHQGGPIGSIAAGAIPDGSITSAKIADGSISTVDLADGAVTNAKLAPIGNAVLGPDTARANLMVNGGMEVWQRGFGPFSTVGAYTADRWMIEAGAGDVRADGANVDAGSQYAAQINVSSGSLWLLNQAEANIGLRGRQVSASVRIRTTAVNTCFITLWADGSGAPSVNSSLHTGGGTWQTLRVGPITVPGDAVHVCVRVNCSAPGQYFADNAMLVVGAVAGDYQPLPVAEEVARCQRYYEASFGQYQAAGYCIATTGAEFVYRYQSLKGGVPTVTMPPAANCYVRTGPATNVPALSMTVAATDRDTCEISVATTASMTLGHGALFLANAPIRVEWNP